MNQPTREERTRQPVVYPRITVDVALKEAGRCRRYSDPVLNEAVIVVLADEVLRLRKLTETLNYPRLTLTAPIEQITAVLRDWEKGRPVNSQDLINALAWRVDNQRREIARLHEQPKVRQ